MKSFFDDIFDAFAQDVYLIFRRARGRFSGLSGIMDMLEQALNNADNQRQSKKQKPFEDPFSDFFSNSFEDLFGESFYQNSAGQKNNYRKRYEYSRDSFPGRTFNRFRMHKSGLPYDDKIAGYYGILKLDYGCKMPEVKTAWKNLCKQYHPDYFGNDPDMQKRNTKIIQKCTEAYKEIEKFLKLYDYSS